VKLCLIDVSMATNVSLQMRDQPSASAACNVCIGEGYAASATNRDRQPVVVRGSSVTCAHNVCRCRGPSVYGPAIGRRRPLPAATPQNGEPTWRSHVKSRS
jgi:hypothetical protein